MVLETQDICYFYHYSNPLQIQQKSSVVDNFDYFYLSKNRFNSISLYITSISQFINKYENCLFYQSCFRQTTKSTDDDVMRRLEDNQLEGAQGDYRNRNAVGPIMDSFRDFCAFRKNIDRRLINEIITDKRFQSLLKKRVCLQCHPHPKNCLSLSWKEFDRPRKRMRDRQGRTIGRITKHENVVTIDLQSEPETDIKNPVNHREQTEIDRLIELLTSIRSSFHYKVELLSDHNQILLKTISNVSFIELNILHLSYCNLTTIQPLNTLNAPNLRVFNFQYNRITELKVLRKIQTWKVKYVNAVNYEPEGCPFGEMYSLLTHYPLISAQIVKGKFESAYYKNRPIWKQHFRKLMRLFQALAVQNNVKKSRRNLIIA